MELTQAGSAVQQPRRPQPEQSYKQTVSLPAATEATTTGYLKDMFTEWSSSHNLRGDHILALSNTRTTTCSLHSFSYAASKIWNSLPDTLKTINFLQFKQEILKYETFSQ